jgi:hypothetical protein
MATKKIDPKDPKAKQASGATPSAGSKKDAEGRKSGRIKLIA